MKQRFLSVCGIIAPALFLFTIILGGALRPGYSHISDTISELFSPGSPNKLLLDTLHTTYAFLLILFGIGVLQTVRRRGQSQRIGVIGASLFIAVGVISALTATVFPQDAWGSPATFRGEMHKVLHGVISLLGILYLILLGIWFDREGGLRGFRTYSLITVGVVGLAAAFFMLSMGGPAMGLAERAAMLAGFQWTFVLSLELTRGEKNNQGCKTSWEMLT